MIDTDAFIAENIDAIGMILTGVYECWDCRKRYTVNDPKTWNPCSWVYCPDCYPKPRRFDGHVTYLRSQPQNGT